MVFDMLSFALGGALLFIAGMQLQKKKEQAVCRQRSLFRDWPIEKISIRDLDPIFQQTELGPTLKSEISFLPNIHVKGGISDLESWILCNFAKNVKRIFEFGTCTGKTTYLLARNSCADAQIVTMTLPPGQHEQYRKGDLDHPSSYQDALLESCFTTFYYSKTPEEKKISQVFEDSKTFDEEPFAESFDLIFIDGSHAYSYVKSDTKKAIKMVKDGGWIFWHDYRGPKRNREIYRALNEIAQIYPLRHIAGTSLVALKKDKAGTAEVLELENEKI